MRAHVMAILAIAVQKFFARFVVYEVALVCVVFCRRSCPRVVL